MAHKVIPNPHLHIAHIQFSGDLTPEDMTCAAELGLGKGQPRYVVLEVLNINRDLPDSFIETARIGFLIHPDLKHMAVVSKSGLLKSLALMSATLSEQRDKISVHDTVAAAEAHLLAMIRRHRL